MSRKNKLARFSKMMEMPNVFQCFSAEEDTLTRLGKAGIDMRGKWSEHFGNTNPIVLELACGKGEYTTGLSDLYPDKNYIGVDIKGARMFIGAQDAIEREKNNVAFLRTRIEFIDRFFAAGEIDQIWITFADPQLKKESKRLTSPYYLNMYPSVLKKSAEIILKTDDPTLYEYSLDTIGADDRYTIDYHTDDIYATGTENPDYLIKTYYEGIHTQLGKTIKILRARLS